MSAYISQAGDTLLRLSYTYQVPLTLLRNSNSSLSAVADTVPLSVGTIVQIPNAWEVSVSYASAASAMQSVAQDLKAAYAAKVAGTSNPTASSASVSVAYSAPASVTYSIPPTIAQFQAPYYKRPMLKVTTDAGAELTYEMRLLSFSADYSNSFSSNMTNGGWFIHMSGEALPIITLQCVWLDTKANMEFDHFLTEYRKNLVAYKSGKYLRVPIVTLYMKQREYKGVIQGCAFSQASDSPLAVSQTLQFVVLQEKRLDAASIQSLTTSVQNSSASEDDFLSSFRNMLSDPVTGLYVDAGSD